MKYSLHILVFALVCIGQISTAYAQAGMDEGYCVGKLTRLYEKQLELYEQALEKGLEPAPISPPNFESCKVNQLNNVKDEQAQICNSFSTPPIAKFGCVYKCINSNWAEVC